MAVLLGEARVGRVSASDRVRQGRRDALSAIATHGETGRDHRRGTKLNSTALPEAAHEELGELAASAEADPPPFAAADDFARKALEDAGR